MRVAPRPRVIAVGPWPQDEIATLEPAEQQKLKAIGASMGVKAAAAQPAGGGGGVFVIDDDSSCDAAGKSKTARAELTVCTAGVEPAACGGTGRGGSPVDLLPLSLQVQRLNRTLREQASREQDLKEQVRRLHCLAEHRKHVVNALKRKVAASEAASE